ncbi:MAG: hypothetical protein KDD69_20235, partial [Bdellovibrionales bacterium]|nr:hypothetical protein [Bdellovibrionales bacterium]
MNTYSRIPTRLAAFALMISALVADAFAQSAFEGTQGAVERSALPIYGGQAEGFVVASNGNLYAGLGSPSGIFCSTDGGTSWSGPPVGSDFGSIAAVAEGETPNTVYMIAGIDAYKSTDACASWSQLEASDGNNDFSRAIAYGHDRLLIGRRDGLIDVSSNNGTSFTATTLSGAITEVLDIAVSPSDDVFFALGSNNATALLFKSIDAGATWADTGVSGNYRLVGVNPENPGVVVLAGMDLVAISTDGGTTFNDVTPMGHRRNEITFVDIPNAADRIYVGSNWTSDNGTTWTDINDGATTDSELNAFLQQDPTT